MCYNAGMNLPPPFPTTLHPSITYQKGAVLPLKAGTNKREARELVMPEGWERLPKTPVTRLRPGNIHNGSKTDIIYVIYARKVD